MNRQVGNGPPTCGKYQISRVPVKEDLPVTQSKVQFGGGVGRSEEERREGNKTKSQALPPPSHASATEPGLGKGRNASSMTVCTFVII